MKTRSSFPYRPCAPLFPLRTVVVTSAPTRHPSTFTAPVPCSRTFAATVPISGLRARIAGSHAGLSAVPQPCHWRAASVAGVVIGTSTARDPPTVWRTPSPGTAMPADLTPTFSRFHQFSPGWPLRPFRSSSSRPISSGGSSTPSSASSFGTWSSVGTAGCDFALVQCPAIPANPNASSMSRFDRPAALRASRIQAVTR